MPIPILPYDQVARRTLANSRTSFPGYPLGTKSFLGRTARGRALAIWQWQKSVEDLDKDIVPSPDSSDDALSAWLSRLALPDGAGGYGRRKPTTASGGQATLTGAKGTAYLDGSIATAEDGTTEIKLSGNVTIAGAPPGSGSIPGSFVAVTAGSAGNLPIGSVLTWSNPPAGADPTFTLTAPLEGALDTEDNPTAYGRIVTQFQNPRRGGVDTDYIYWAETASGVYAVYVYPHRHGLGSVDVVILSAGSGAARIPGSATAAQAAVTASRPVAVNGATVFVPAASTAHLIRVRVAPSSASRYGFDWVDTATSYTVDLYTPGAPATLRLNTLAPASLKNAITNYIGGTASAPRLQALSTGSVINLPIRAVNWSDGGGKTTLTLETLPTGWVTPTIGDTVYAYGPVVATIAAGELALNDSLGPSRKSSYGDSIMPWQDTLTVSGLIRVAEDAIDTDGTKLIAEVLAGGATIDGVAADVEGNDPISTSPEILVVSHVAVTQ